MHGSHMMRPGSMPCRECLEVIMVYNYVRLLTRHVALAEC
jgi:hypothetical protein